MKQASRGLLPADLTYRQREALRTDAALGRVVFGRGALDLAIGEILHRLDRGNRLIRLGYSRLVDYARERLGLPARSAFQLLRLARGLHGRPFLRRALVAGAITRSKALTILPVSFGPQQERLWVAAAMTSSLQQLEEGLRHLGKEPPQGSSFQAQGIWLRMSPAQQDRLDRAMALAEEQLGFGCPRWQCLESICQEFLASFGSSVPPDQGWDEEPRPPPAAREQELRARAMVVAEQLHALEEAYRVAEEPVPLEQAGALELDAKLRELLWARRGYDLAFGALAEQLASCRYWQVLGYRCLEEYCRERLGIAPRSVRERIWLERRMSALPELRAALESGELTYSKALLVARGATAENVERRIRAAASTTWQQTKRKSEEAERRRNRAAGVRREWGPGAAARTIRVAIAAAQECVRRRYGVEIDAGEALAVIADHFVEVWEAHERADPRRGPSEKRRRALMRARGLCAAPGCTRPAEHLHHLIFRSRGGPDEPWNQIPLCCRHHLGGVHHGYLEVTGRAGERLTWKPATGEVWITEGEDEVRLWA